MFYLTQPSTLQETLSDPKGWMDRTYSNIKDKVTEILNGGLVKHLDLIILDMINQRL